MRAIVFENLKPNHVSLVHWYLWRGYQIFCLNALPEDEANQTLRRFLSSGKISPLTLQELPYVNVSPVANNAFAVIEAIYDRLFGNRSRMIRRMTRLYQSDDIHLALKKHLLTELAEYFHCRLLREEIQKALPSFQEMLLVPTRSTDTAMTRIYNRALQASGQEEMIRGKKVGFPLWASLVGRCRMALKRVRPFGACLFALAAAVPQYARFLAARPRKSTHEFGIAIVNPLREFANEVRGFDFLLDSRRIHKGNTLFIPLLPLTKEHLRKTAEKGLAVAGKYGPIPAAVFWKIMANAAAVLTVSLFLPEWIFRVSSVLVLDYLLWNGFLTQHRVRKFVTSGDFSFRQIGRNILLKQAGSETWYFLDTENMGGMNFIPTEQEPYRHYFWGYLHYDHVVTWSQRAADYHKIHKQKVGKYSSVGCLWSEHIQDIREGKIPSDFLEQLKARGFTPRHKLIAVFDSTYSSVARTNCNDGIDFALVIQKLLEDVEEAFVVWKEKKPRSKERIAYKMLHFGSDFERLVRIYNRIEEHPRCWFPGYDASSAEITAFSDLTISFPFTSPTVESIGARRKAIYYVPNGKFRGCFFEKIPDLVARTPEELTRLARKLLFDTTDQDYERFINEHMSGRIAPYLDGQALTRFRNLLCNVSGEQSSSVPDAVNS